MSFMSQFYFEDPYLGVHGEVNVCTNWLNLMAT